MGVRAGLVWTWSNLRTPRRFVAVLPCSSCTGLLGSRAFGDVCWPAACAQQQGASSFVAQGWRDVQCRTRALHVLLEFLHATHPTKHVLSQQQPTAKRALADVVFVLIRPSLQQG